MLRTYRALFCSLVVGGALLAASPSPAVAQGKSSRGAGGSATGQPTVTASIRLTKGMQVEIRDFYESHRGREIESLPPGIRKRLARGKPLPPGIARRYAPDGLGSRLGLARGYRLMEVGVDVLLVEVATNVIHDVLRDAIL